MSTVRINPDAHERLKRLALEENVTLQTILERALEKYEEARFFARLDFDFAQLAADKTAWREYACEVAAWDQSWPRTE